jgi:hypothetical protein
MKIILNKTILLCVTVFLIPLTPRLFHPNERIKFFHPKPIEPITPKEVQRVPQDIVMSMIQVESNGNDSAYNKSEEAAGCLQIRPIMVREVNRILRKNGDIRRFKLKDRWDRDKSLQMFWVWRDYHHPNSTDEVIARNWNGGPNGYNKKSTEKYWNKVSDCLDSK